MKQKVMLFAGTTEGRLLYEFLEAEGFKAMVFVTTAYGEQLLSMGKEETGGTAGFTQDAWTGKKWKNR